jgi:hypothetical protein
MTPSIIIVNDNTERLLKGRLESVYAGTNGTPLDIRVVDSHSEDRSVQMVKEESPTVTLLQNNCVSANPSKPSYRTRALVVTCSFGRRVRPQQGRAGESQLCRTTLGTRAVLI